MKKTLILILVLLSLALLMIRFSAQITELLLGIKQKSGISILSVPDEAQVYLDGKEVGKTPYEDKNLDAKVYRIKIQKDQTYWEGKVKLTAGTLTVVNREISPDQSSAAGEMLTLEKGHGVTVISNPSDSNVEIDGKVYGKTPLLVNIDSGEHTFNINHPNYLKRSIRAFQPEGFNLTVSVDLSLSEADLTAIPTPVITTTPELIVKDTPTGFLRVRDKPSLVGKEIAQVKPGQILILLEELPSWYRVRLPDNTEGYVSSTYTEKKPSSS